MRFGADFGPKFSKLFRDRKIFAFEIARDRAEIRAARAERLSDRPRSVNCPQIDAAREIWCDSRRISNRNFRKFSAATTFGARNRAEIRCAPRAAAWLRSLQVLRHCAECWHAAAREIRCDCRRIKNSNRNCETIGVLGLQPIPQPFWGHPSYYVDRALPPSDHSYDSLEPFRIH